MGSFSWVGLVKFAGLTWRKQREASDAVAGWGSCRPAPLEKKPTMGGMGEKGLVV